MRLKSGMLFKKTNVGWVERSEAQHTQLVVIMHVEKVQCWAPLNTNLHEKI